MQDDYQGPVRVHGLVVPELLLVLLREGRWNHPGEPAIARVMPWFRHPLDFLGSTEQMERESQSLDRLIQDDELATLFDSPEDRRELVRSSCLGWMSTAPRYHATTWNWPRPPGQGEIFHAARLQRDRSG